MILKELSALQTETISRLHNKQEYDRDQYVFPARLNTDVKENYYY